MTRPDCQRQFHRLGVILIALGLLLAACGGSADVSAPDGMLATVLSDPPPQFPTATAGTIVVAATATVTPTEPLPSPTATATATITPTPTPVEPTATMSPIPTEVDDDRPVIVLDPGHDRMFPSALGIEYQVNLRTALVAQRGAGGCWLSRLSDAGDERVCLSR